MKSLLPGKAERKVWQDFFPKRKPKDKQTKNRNVREITNTLTIYVVISSKFKSLYSSRWQFKPPMD